MSRKLKRHLRRIVAAMAVFAGALLLPLEGVASLAVFLAAYALAGGDVVWNAVRNIARGRVFDENFLMTVATVGAFGLGEYPEGVAVMLFYQVGEWFQTYAVGQSRRSIAELMDIRPDVAHVQRGDALVTVDPEDVRVGEVVVVKPGERIPLDGRVVDGRSAVDTSALTGESVPREVEPGADVISGCINQTHRLTMRVAKVYGQSTVAKILELVENAGDKKSRSEAFIHRFAKVYTPLVVVAAVLLALIPPVVFAAPFAVWIERALTFLVISCPCALVISVPLSFFGGIGGASKSGVLVKGGNYLEALASADTVVFDKTGTLTRGSFDVTAVKASHRSRDALLELAAYAEDGSNHPIADSIGRAYGRAVDRTRVADVEEIPGHGLRAVVDGRVVLAGNARLMQRENVALDGPAPVGTAVHMAVDGRYEGYLLIEDEVKADAAQAVADLRKAGVGRLVMLTGDADAIGRKVAARLGLDHAYTELLPAGKVERVERLMAEKRGRGGLVFVGDGINDAPALARADVGIAMGGLGSDAAIEAADVVIMTDEPSRIAVAMRIARKTLAIVRQNIAFALGVKGVVLVLGAVGLASMWAAVFADVGVSVLAILNAMRALRIDRPACRCEAGRASPGCPIHRPAGAAA